MVLKLLALSLTVLVLIPSGAHLLELPAKITMNEDDYFTVQRIYEGWALFAVPILAAILTNGALWWSMRRNGEPAARWALASALLVCLTLVIFFVWVFPGNQATANWSSVPADWEMLRRNWEYGHAVNALVAFAAVLATGRAIIGTTDEEPRARPSRRIGPSRT